MLQLAEGQSVITEPKANLITTLSFEELTGGIIIVKAQIDDTKDSVNFIIDTGSGGASLDSTLAAFLGWDLKPSEKTVRGIAGIKKVPFSFNHTIHFNHLDLFNIDMYINDYSLLTSVYGVRIDGILGYTFLKYYIFHINYDTHLISIYTPGAYNYKFGSFLNSNFYNLPATEIVLQDLNKIKPNFIFDIGAGLSVLLSSQLDSANHLLDPKRKVFQVQAEGVGGKKQMELSVIKRIQVGKYRFRNIPVHVFDDEFNVTNFPKLGGLLGNEILRRFNVVLNYSAHTIYIMPNTHYYDAFDYAYTGLGIYLVDNAITIVDVLPGSPGDKAGLQSGDIVFSVNKKLVDNIQDLKTALHNSFGKQQIVVIRNKELLIKNIRVIDIRK